MTSQNTLLNIDNIRLPSPPSVALRLLEAVRHERFTYQEVADIITCDPALTAKVLRVVNSVFYALPEKIGDIERALVILGVNTVKNIAFSFTLMDGLKAACDGPFDIDYFWKRSIIAATSTELFARHLGIDDDDLYVSALLQDLGILVLHSNFPHEYSRLLEEKNREKAPIQALEMRDFGFTHQELCSAVLKKWNLPESIHLPVGYHHDYQEAPEACRTSARVLFLSNALSSVYSDTADLDKIRFCSAIITRDLGISDGELESLVEQNVQRMVEICSQFQIHSDGIKPLAALLQEANEGLSNLNLSYEKLLEEYRKEKQQAEALARELARANEKLNEANHKLNELARHDPLTGLPNRRYLFEFLGQELGRARRYGEPLSVMILDIDHFKRVNDTHGHQIGDLVLEAMAETLMRHKRDADLIARYGGEEFVMVMPKTGAEGAAALAERLRRGAEELAIPLEEQAIGVTVSIGTATSGPEGGELAADRLIGIADQALYRAKNEGRNRVVSAPPSD
jgi:diguanylate cyclase (GGDEF)-like protein